MIEQLAAKQEAAEKAQRAPEPPASRADPAPRVWLVQSDGPRRDRADDRASRVRAAAVGAASA